MAEVHKKIHGDLPSSIESGQRDGGTRAWHNGWGLPETWGDSTSSNMGAEGARVPTRQLCVDPGSPTAEVQRSTSLAVQSGTPYPVPNMIGPEQEATTSVMIIRR